MTGDQRGTRRKLRILEHARISGDVNRTCRYFGVGRASFHRWREAFQAEFHWHVEDQGIRHAYIKPSLPQFNGNVELSHRSDEQEFYQLLSYKGDVDLEAKLQDGERFYNLVRPHGAHHSKTPPEALRAKQ